MGSNLPRVLVTGAGGFIGSHLVKYLKKKGYWVRGVDVVKSQYMDVPADEFLLLDLRNRQNCLKVCEEVKEVYSLAANMGGIGFIETVKAEIMHDNVLINTHMIESARIQGVSRYFFASSACIYPTYKQTDANVTPLKENDAYPADPDNEYGWEKLFTERLCQDYYEDYSLETRVARFHNIFGPFGTWDGGREKAPAAMCRKVALAEDPGVIEIWGDGKQTRSFCYVDDCVEGIYKIMQSDCHEPLNIGSDRMVTIDELADIVIQISNKKIKKQYDISKPQGVRGRNSDNELSKSVLSWEPIISLEKGLEITYQWINSQVCQTQNISIP